MPVSRLARARTQLDHAEDGRVDGQHIERESVVHRLWVGCGRQDYDHARHAREVWERSFRSWCFVCFCQGGNRGHDIGYDAEQQGEPGVAGELQSTMPAAAEPPHSASNRVTRQRVFLVTETAKTSSGPMP